jgi:hypothetical protein
MIITGYSEAVRQLQMKTLSDIRTACQWMAQQDAERTEAEWLAAGVYVEPGECWPASDRLPRTNAEEC